VQGLSVLTSASQPGGDGSLTVAEDPLCRRRIQPTSRVQTAPSRCVERGFLSGIRESGVEH
jgi:hypothetical protein